MLPIRIADTTSQNIHDLVSGGVRESRFIEYKKAISVSKDSDKKEFLADVSAFANLSGGDIIYGVSESDGVASAVHGLGGIDIDATVLQIENLLRDAIQPRIIGLQTQVVSGFESGLCIIIRVPRSWIGPHMVTYQGTNRFYMRGNGSKSPMDITDLRAAFESTSRVLDTIRHWRADRVGRIAAGEASVPLPELPTMIVHVIPQDFVEFPYRITPEQLNSTQSRLAFRLLNENSWDHRLNIDGLINYVNYNTNASTEHGEYCQIYRSGKVESVCCSLGNQAPGGTPLLASQWYETAILNATSSYINGLRAFGVLSPLVVMVSFVRVNGLRMAVDRWRGSQRHVIDRDAIFLPEVVLQQDPQDLPVVLRPIFDSMWNASGFARSGNYGTDGRWAVGGLRGVPHQPSGAS